MIVRGPDPPRRPGGKPIAQIDDAERGEIVQGIVGEGPLPPGKGPGRPENRQVLRDVGQE